MTKLLSPELITYDCRLECQIVLSLFLQGDSGGKVNIFGGDIGFGGLGIACWPLVPKFAGSNPAEAVGYLGRKNPQHAFLRRGSKAVGPMS